MDDLISKTAVVEILSTMQGRCDTKAALVQNSKIWQQVKDMPAVEAEPVRHGKWIGISDGYADGYPVYDEWECSVCGTVFEDEKPDYKYCPNCGAKMDERKEE